jgi:hypothetical protein
LHDIAIKQPPFFEGISPCLISRGHLFIAILLDVMMPLSIHFSQAGYPWSQQNSNFSAVKSAYLKEIP